MASVINRYDVYGIPHGGGDPVAYVSITPPSFQAGQAVNDAFLNHVRDFFAVQQGVETVSVTEVATVSTQI